jgi:hypothetical protein
MQPTSRVYRQGSTHRGARAQAKSERGGGGGGESEGGSRPSRAACGAAQQRYPHRCCGDALASLVRDEQTLS